MTADFNAALSALSPAQKRDLVKLGEGWAAADPHFPEATGDRHYRFSCSDTVELRASFHGKEWTLIRREMRQGVFCGTNGWTFPSLSQLVKFHNS